MALLTDLPAELLEKILEQVVHLHQADQHHPHRCLEYCPICESDEGSQDIRLKARANLESKQKYHSTFTLPSPTYMTPRATTELETSWPEALPSNPLLPLCLVNRTFGKCAQQALFTHVTLLDQWQAHLFSQTLTSPSLTQNALSSPIDDQHPPASLAHQVRSLQFKFIGPCSMGRGGGSLICEIIRSCPVLENITMATSLLTRCQEPLLDAFASRPFIKSFVVLENSYKDDSLFTWPAEQVVARLFSKWDFLETVELIRLPMSAPLMYWEPGGYDSRLPRLNCALRTIVLIDLMMNEGDLRMILKGSRASLRKLQLTRPTAWLHRPGLFRILTECISPALESLTLEVSNGWGGLIFPEEDGRPELNPGLLDHIFKTSSTLSNLKELSFAGDLVGDEFLNLLPQSIVKLTWDRCDVSYAAFAEALTSHTANSPQRPPPSQLHVPPDAETRPTRWLPELKCCSFYNFPDWGVESAYIISLELKARQAWLHTCRPYYGRNFI